MFSSQSMIRGIPLTPYSYANEAMVPIIDSGTNFVGLAYDYEENYIYYSEVKVDMVYRIRPNGEGRNNTVAIHCYIRYFVFRYIIQFV